MNIPSSAGGFPWKADGDYRTLVYIKNETATARKITADLYYDGVSYGIGLTEVKAGQTIAIDFREIRDAQTPDRLGRVIPLDLEHGQIAWSVKGGENKTLSARSEQISVSEGVASTYSCANCCPDSYYDGILIPYDAEEGIGGMVPFRALQQDSTCLQTLGTP